VNNRTSAAATYFVCGGITVLLAVKGLIHPHELPQYSKVWNEFLFQWGGPLSGLVLGGLLIAVGILTRIAKDPAENTQELNFTYEADIPMAPVMAGFLLFLVIMTVTAVAPYTGERGIEPGQLALVPVLFLGFGFGAWFLLHYRRLTILNAASRTFEIRYGKPWALLRLRYEFSDYQSVGVEEVKRERNSVYRVVANGTKGSKMITFCFSADAANTCVENIVQVTGWAATAAAHS
jgi:hypothetical protein